ncbi:chromosomal replication initiator protein DnaA [Campylobacter sp. MIT 97-5078]|uniref:chromosomal replication initiator protein DnaA n=1 Tax=Campylobacter sp. MIT 97-5078 TaxID=1548153 RepID=UPI000512EBF4|nr:chromosomal replication initiator protein DnaA [Campylobacter sp. MIT 97-5078]KGI55502.1 chromosomal replication initiation protein [Campylobacter sp. MIT 97-5078]TQR25566.1 chromosomal replication initiator protein DnaA [Campylobacter sp. MIT 97-5078]
MDAADILKHFEKEISRNEFENFITPLILNEKASKADQLIFNAPNELMAKFIQTKYADRISHFYEVQSGNKAKVLIQSISLKNNSKYNLKTPIKHGTSTVLNPSYTFESFVVGDSNQYAYATCKAASAKDKLGKLYNPVFIYGPTGLGKTHLLQAVGNTCLELGKIVIYATSENFINDFSSHLMNKSMDKFHEKYRNCDVLLIDDVQFLGKTDKIQEEFFFTFNEVKEKFGQIIMTSDTPPNMLKGITERLKSRFANGAIADITPPELDTKMAIIRKKCEFNGVSLNNEIISYIATSMGDNIREIEGMITNLNAYSRLINQEITLDIAKSFMKDHIKEQKENIDIDDILSVVCKDFNIKANDIKSNKKTQNIVTARRLVIFLARELTSMSMPQLAKFFEMKDHTAISHNIKKINELIKEKNDLKDKINELKNKILTKIQS